MGIVGFASIPALQHRVVDLVAAERRLILPETKAPQPEGRNARATAEVWSRLDVGLSSFRPYS
jgi:hypothetical protein